MTEPSPNPGQRLQTVQIIAGGIIAGAGAFLAVAVMIRGDGLAHPPAESPMVTYVLIALGALFILACQIVPGIVTSSGRERILQSSSGRGDEPLLALYQTQLIVGLALAEAAALLAIVAYMVEGQTVSLIAGFIFMGFLVAQFPTQRGVDAWLAEQAEMLQHVDGPPADDHPKD